MLAYILRRVLATIPTLWLVVTIVFFAVRIVPGDPAVAALGENASAAALEAFRARMGIDRPLTEQYVRFMSGLLQGDLGTSLITRRSATADIMAVLPHTVQLTVSALLVGLILGIPMGVLTAVYRNRAIDYVGRIVSLAGLSLPAFYLGILLIIFIGLSFDSIPTGGVAPFSQPWENLRHLLLPSLSLGLIAAAYITRVARSVMLNTLNEDYVRSARAKGLSETRVLFRHALRSAALPVLSLSGLFFLTLIGSSVLTETVFARPGLGRLMVGAVQNRDYTLVQASMIVYATLVVLINLVVDVLYGVFDPRVRYDT